MMEILVEHRNEYRVIPVSVKRYAKRARYNNLCFGGHNHDSLEILLVRSGEMQVKLGDEGITLLPGDAALVNPYVTHTGMLEDSADAQVEYDCLMLELVHYETKFAGSRFDSLLTDILQGKKQFAVHWHRDSDEAAQLSTCMDNLKAQYEEAIRECSPALEGGMMCEVYRLLTLLTATAADTPPSEAFRRDLVFIRSITDYIAEHYAAPLSGDDVCAAFGFSRRNFSRLFKRSFGTTFTEYLREYRIQRAANGFYESELSVPEIAAAVGFTDYCYFSRSFKSIMGISPARYFKSRSR